MTEYINRDAFLSECRKRYCDNCERRKGVKNGKPKFLYAIGDAPCRACMIDDVLTDLEDAPAADVAPVVHGKWEKKQVFGVEETSVEELHSAFCPVCQRYLTTPYSYYFTHYTYCPNCGARMDGDGE